MCASREVDLSNLKLITILWCFVTLFGLEFFYLHSLYNILISFLNSFSFSLRFIISDTFDLLAWKCQNGIGHAYIYHKFAHILSYRDNAKPRTFLFDKKLMSSRVMNIFYFNIPFKITIILAVTNYVFWITWVQNQSLI